MSAERPPAAGVYYRREDYAGLPRRLLIDLIDVPVAIVLAVLVIHAVHAVAPALQDSPVPLLLWAGVWFAYFVLLKRSAFRTLGYKAAGARIVDLAGGRPGIFSLVARLVFAFLGPLNFVTDMFWLTGDPDRQAIRDKFAGTYVIRQHAAPAGAGPIVGRNYMFFGMSFLFREVRGKRE
jgi:uncharacterized RDD family membrane protein YckC